DGEAETLLERAPDLRDVLDLVPVHQAHPCTRLGDQLRHCRVGAKGGDVVDELRAERERAPGDLRLGSVGRDRHSFQPFDDGNDALEGAAGTGPLSRRSGTGPTRRSSSSSETGSWPGRVDSPPTSTIVAPSSIIRRAAAAAVSGSRWTPPSENESGVTLTMPITEGRGKRFDISGYFLRWGSTTRNGARRGGSCAPSSARRARASSGQPCPGCCGRSAPSRRR